MFLDLHAIPVPAVFSTPGVNFREVIFFHAVGEYSPIRAQALLGSSAC